MKHGFLRGIGALAVLFACLVLLPVFTLGAAAGNTNEGEPMSGDPVEYGIFLGGVRVTDENRTDIFGDGGVASYDPDRNLLTITGGQNTRIDAAPMATDEENPTALGTYSLYATVPDLRVEISGTVKFTHGIYLKKGNVIVKGNATRVTFLGGDNSPTYITVADGNLSVLDGSKVICESLAAIRNDCFSATNLVVQGGAVEVNDEGNVPGFSHMLFGKQSVRIREATVEYRASNLGCETFLASDGDIQITEGKLYARNVRVFLLLGGGKLSVGANSMLWANDCLHGMQIIGDADFRKSTVEISSFYSGIVLSSMKDNTFRAQDCRMTLKQPGYAALERLLKASAEASGTPDQYMANSRADYERTVSKAENAGFYANRMTMEFSDCWLDITGYRTGIFYRSQGKTLSLRDGCRLSVDAVSAALVAMVTEADSVSFGSRISGNVLVQVLPAEGVLGDFGKYLVTLVDEDGELTQQSDKRLGAPQDVFDAYSGFAERVETTVDEFRMSSVLLPLGILLASTGCAVAVYLLCRRLRRTHGGQRTKKRPGANGTSETTKTAETTGAGEETDHHAD